jgi:hypothetical protein
MFRPEQDTSEAAAVARCNFHLLVHGLYFGTGRGLPLRSMAT